MEGLEFRVWVLELKGLGFSELGYRVEGLGSWVGGYTDLFKGVCGFGFGLLEGGSLKGPRVLSRLQIYTNVL